MSALPQYPCQDECAWRPDDEHRAGGPRRFVCRGCGSQWDRTQGWTPCDLDGTVPPGVRAELG